MAPVATVAQEKVAFNPTYKPTWGFDRAETTTLEEKIEAAREEARAISKAKGIESRESALAWEVVEELLTAAARRREQEPKTYFERYCRENPGAIEALMYDI